MTKAAGITLTTDQLKLDTSSIDDPSVSIARLIKLAQEGDLDAFDQVIILYQNKVFATSWRLMGNKEDARDATQEVFLRVFKYLKTFNAEKDFSSWLYRIIINVCHDLARKRGNKDQMISFESERELGNLGDITSSENLEESLIRSQEQILVLKALRTLSEKERTAIVLRDMEGLSTAEVAQILGSSQTTVRSQICTARTKIKTFCDRFLARQYRNV
jgi:RNA polymerase sigma-70 factor, ECF subfamily